MSTRDVARAFIDAWNSHDPEAVRAVFAPDGRLRDSSNPDEISGPAIAASVKRALERIPDIAFSLTSVLEADDGRVAFEWHLRGHAALPEGGSIPVELRGCDVCRVKDGKIVELRGYFDRAAIMEQMQRAAAPSPR
jgi:ketosteroid isomerase-like protein